MRLPAINPGQRAIVSGKTGSGKTTGAVWLLSRSPGCWLVLDRKYDALLGKLGLHVGLNSDYEKAWKKSRILIVRPETSDPEILDDWIAHISETWNNVGLLVDELYYIHSAGRAGDGLIGWLTRGRSRGQSFIGLTQRPAWISKFCFSEADFIGAYSLNLVEDRKRIFEFTGRDEVMAKLGKHFWQWYDVSNDQLATYAPIPATNLMSRFKIDR